MILLYLLVIPLYFGIIAVFDGPSVPGPNECKLVSSRKGNLLYQCDDETDDPTINNVGGSNEHTDIQKLHGRRT